MAVGGSSAEKREAPMLDALEDAARDAERIREALARVIPSGSSADDA